MHRLNRHPTLTSSHCWHGRPNFGQAPRLSRHLTANEKQPTRETQLCYAHTSTLAAMDRPSSSQSYRY